MRLAIAFQPDASADDIVADFIQDAAGFLAVEDELGAEVLEGFQRCDSGLIGHGSENTKHQTPNTRETPSTKGTYSIVTPPGHPLVLVLGV